MSIQSAIFIVAVSYAIKNAAEAYVIVSQADRITQLDNRLSSGENLNVTTIATFRDPSSHQGMTGDGALLLELRLKSAVSMDKVKGAVTRSLIAVDGDKTGPLKDVKVSIPPKGFVHAAFADTFGVKITNDQADPKYAKLFRGFEGVSKAKAVAWKVSPDLLKAGGEDASGSWTIQYAMFYGVNATDGLSDRAIVPCNLGDLGTLAKDPTDGTVGLTIDGTGDGSSISIHCKDVTGHYVGFGILARDASAAPEPSGIVSALPGNTYAFKPKNQYTVILDTNSQDLGLYTLDTFTDSYQWDFGDATKFPNSEHYADLVWGSNGKWTMTPSTAPLLHSSKAATPRSALPPADMTTISHTVPRSGIRSITSSVSYQ